MPNPGQVLSEMDFPSGPWTGFYNYGRSTRKHRMDLVLTFCNHTISGDSSDDIGRFLSVGLMTQRVNVTGRRLTSARTTFTTAGFARAKGSGDYGNCLTSQADFTSGRLDRAKAKRIMRARKSPRSSEQVSFEFCRGRRPQLQRLQAGAASTRD